MTVPGIVVLATYTGDDVATNFPYGFEIPNADSAVVELEEISTAIYTTLTTGQYSIAGLGDVAGGSVTYNPGTPLAATHKIHIGRDTLKTQAVTVSNQAAYFPDITENVWDRLTMFTQELAAEMSRAFKVGTGKTAGTILAGADGTLPAWDASGNLVPSVATVADLETAAGLADGSALTRETIADLIALATGPGYAPLKENTVVFVNGRGYVKSTGATDLPTIPGFVPYGNTAGLAQFGAMGNCVITKGLFISGTDDSTALQAAWDWQQAVEGRSLEGDINSKYLITSTITGSGAPFSINWRGATWFKNSSGNAFSFTATTSHYDLTANYTPGDLALTVASTGTAFDAGQPFVVYSDAIARANRDSGNDASQYRTGEWAFATVGTTHTSIVLNRPLFDVIGIDPNDPNLAVALVDEARVAAYSTLLNARITVSDFPAMEWVGGEGQYSEGHGQGSGSIWQGTSLVMIGYSGTVRGFHVNRGYDAAINAAGCYRMRIENCYASRLENNTGDSQIGYGVSDSSFGTIVHGCTWVDCRHGFTTGNATQTVDEKTADTLAVPGSVNAVVDSCYGIDFSDNAPFDTHHGASFTTFVNCYAGNCQAPYVYALRGRELKVIEPVARNCQKGIIAFTEFASGSPNDDLYTAGKEERDSTRVHVVGGDMQLAGTALECTYGGLTLSGHMKVRSSTHVFAEVEGELHMQGSVDFVVETFEGALPLVAANNTGVIEATDADHSSKGNLVGPTLVKTYPGSSFTVDFSAATSTGIEFVNMEANSSFVNDGDTVVTVPTGMDLFSALGTVSGQGKLTFDIDGEADNAQTPELVGREINVDSVDGTVRWLAEKPGKPLQSLLADYTRLDIAGTGSEINNAYIPPLISAVQHMATQSGGLIHMEQVFSKAGTNGTATMKYDSYTAFQEQIIMTAASNSLHLNCKMVVQDVNTLITEFNFLSVDATGAATQTELRQDRVLSDTHSSPDLDTKTGTPLDLDPTIAVGDTITLHYTEIQVTSGGYF